MRLLWEVFFCSRFFALAKRVRKSSISHNSVIIYYFVKHI
ncbi:hypothetical protein TSAR_013029 [Trichomalopsis sarcophagae]|uniref:Uncharacterized protein n=1 Tax=Trichomalopsis sarcophagae TaxID=543379 RepID=A0A232EFA7_9HYME|nr:hypothetical protein TSAR_013029 [Trichomalopsis sarcophagae]